MMPDRLFMAAVLAAAVLIIYKHKENIRRLLAGTENRLELKRGAKGMSDIAVIGGGAWGTALAIVARRADTLTHSALGLRSGSMRFHQSSPPERSLSPRL